MVFVTAKLKKMWGKTVRGGVDHYDVVRVIIRLPVGLPQCPEALAAVHAVLPDAVLVRTLPPRGETGINQSQTAIAMASFAENLAGQIKVHIAHK